MVSAGRIALGGVSTNSKTYSNKLTMVVTSSTPDKVPEIANAMAEAFVNEINDLLGSKTLQVVDNAVTVQAYRTISVPLVVAIFGVVAFILTCGVIFVKEFFSARVYSVAQCEAKEELILGLIPYQK